MDSLTFKGSIEDINQALEKKENFSFSRWGDGEFGCLLHPSARRNRDGHQYFETLSEALKEVLLSRPEYLLGMQPKAIRDMGEEINKWMDENKLSFDWINADILHNASRHDEMNDFCKALKQRRCIFVAPERLKKIAMKIGRGMVRVPLIDCWKWYRQIYTDICDLIEKDTVILYCAGMTSNVLIHHIWNDYKDTVSQIDCGSVFDPYCGLKTRQYHSEILERLGAM